MILHDIHRKASVYNISLKQNKQYMTGCKSAKDSGNKKGYSAGVTLNQRSCRGINMRVVLERHEEVTVLDQH